MVSSHARPLHSVESDEAGDSVSGPSVEQRREWGREGARRRWGDGPRRTLRLDDLTPEQRDVFRALVEMVRSPRTEKPAA